MKNKEKGISASYLAQLSKATGIVRTAAEGSKIVFGSSDMAIVSQLGSSRMMKVTEEAREKYSEFFRLKTERKIEVRTTYAGRVDSIRNDRTRSLMEKYQENAIKFLDNYSDASYYDLNIY